MTIPLKIFIVDDEFQSRNFLSKLIMAHHSDVQIVGEAATVEAAKQGLHDTRPDLLFLDVMLNDETGFDLLQQLDDISFEVIFTTAHDEYAIRAFKFNALDYLLKPIDSEELDAALQKVKDKFSRQQLNSTDVVQNFLSSLQFPKTLEKKIPIPTSEGFLLVPLQEIIYCQSSGNYTQLNLANKKKLISSYTLKHYDEMLGDYQFFRAHKSFLINLAHVTQYKKGEGGTIVMSDNMEIELSRRNKEAFIKLFKG